MTIKLWNWGKNWKCDQTFEGHSHYVMSLAFNPRDPNTFASACLDRTVKVWSLGSSSPNFTLNAHNPKGVNFVEYYPQSDKPYLITASDDKTVKVWDYQTKECIATMEGHTSNVSFAIFHPELPIIISGAEDNSIKIWNSNTYKLEKTLNYGFERAWCIAFRKGRNSIALGFDAGHLIINMGSEEPAISMDPVGKIIWAKHSEVFSSAVNKSTTASNEIIDGEVLPLSQKELGSVEVYPTTLVHSPNGRFVAVAGDGEYIIYTALAWRNKSYGKALDFVWAQDSNEFAIREDSNTIKLFKNFKERSFTVQFAYTAEKIYGGSLLSVKGDGFISLFDWETGILVRRIDINPINVYWSEGGDLLLISGEEASYVLRFDRDSFLNALQNDSLDPEEGVEEAFEVLYDIPEVITSGKWIGDCFLFTTYSNRLNYLVGGKTYTISHFDKQVYLLGYIPRDSRVYISDKDINIVSFHLSLSVLEYQTIILRGEFEQAEELLQDIPENEMSKIARFLESQGLKEEALNITNDVDQKFDLALSIGKLNIAEEIIENSLKFDSNKWKLLGDSALKNWNIKLAKKSFQKANDLESLMLLYTSISDKEGLSNLAIIAKDSGKYNIAFNALWCIGDINNAIDLLKTTGRNPEAALLALTYGGNVDDAVESWKNQLINDNKSKTADRILKISDDQSKFPTPLEINNVQPKPLIDLTPDISNESQQTKLTQETSE